MKTSSLLSILGIALLGFACTTTTTTTLPAPTTTDEKPTDPVVIEDEGPTDPPPPPKKPSSSSSTSSSSGSPPPPPVKGLCEDQTSQQACVECCSTAHEDGAGVYLVALTDCLCEPSKCGDVCADTLCNFDEPANPDAACNACINGSDVNTKCQDTVSVHCNASADCMSFNKCLQQSDCQGKP